MSESNTGHCTVCPIYRPDTTPHQPHRPPVCDTDRQTLGRHLTEIAHLHTTLTTTETPIIDNRQHERFGVTYLANNQRHVFSRGWHNSDPLAALGGVAPINAKTTQPSVSGSRERPMPISARRHDLAAPARVPNPTSQARTHPQDQIGDLSTATVLDQWVRDVRDTLYPGHHLPPATVDQLVAWLRTRLDLPGGIIDTHPAVEEFATEIRALRSALRAVTGETEPRPEPCDGIPCKRCNLTTLYRQGEDITCINPDCQTVLRDGEYQEWVKTLTAEYRTRRHAEQAA